MKEYTRIQKGYKGIHRNLRERKGTLGEYKECHRTTARPQVIFFSGLCFPVFPMFVVPGILIQGNTREYKGK